MTHPEPTPETAERLTEKHRQHVHRDGCHRWFDPAADAMLDLVGDTAQVLAALHDEQEARARVEDGRDIAAHFIGNWLYNEDGELDSWISDAYEALRVAGADPERGMSLAALAPDASEGEANAD